MLLDCPVEFEAWSMTLHLRPDLFPILRYQQFEDVIHNEVDDPIGGVLQTVAPDSSDVRAMIELKVIPANSRRCKQTQATQWNDWHALSFASIEALHDKYAMAASSPKRWQRILAGLFVRFFVWQGEERFISDEELNKTSSRMHDNEKDLQAASVKVGQHLFEVQLRLTAYAPSNQKQAAIRKLQEMAAVLNKFTEPRLGVISVLINH